LDKLVVASGIASIGLGVGFIITKQVFPMLSYAYTEGGIGAVVLGIGMIIWGRRLGAKKDVKQ
jgi:hypothetical protein